MDDAPGLWDAPAAASPPDDAPAAEGPTTDELIPAIRTLFTEHLALKPAAAIPALLKLCAFRKSPAHEAACEAALKTAVKRGILVKNGGELCLVARSIDDYERDDLKEQLLAALGKSWTGRDEAPQLLARWLGFRRTGHKIEEAVKSLINGLLREGRLEKDGARVRRV
jgi:hypothetical protein